MIGNPEQTPENRAWVLYILKCLQSNSGKFLFYTGITNCWEKRYLKHKTGRGAKFTKCNPVVEGHPILMNLTHSEALKLEREYKKLPSAKKEELLKISLKNSS